jgi:MFS family permease
LRRLLAVAGESFVAFRDVFANARLRRLTLALTGSELGAWSASIVFAVVAFRAGGAGAVGVLALIRFLPAAFAAPLVSVVGDRHNRVLVMLSSDLLRALALGGAAVAAFADAPVGVIYGIAGFVTIVSTVFQPAQAALVPSLAETPTQLTATNVVSSTIESVASFAGPAIGGVVVGVAGAGTAFVVCAGMFAWSAFLISLLRGGKVEGAPPPPETLWQMATAGFRTILLDRTVRAIMTVFTAQFVVAGALSVLVVVVALRYLDIGEGGLGALNSALGVGGLVGAIGAMTLVGRRRLATAFGAGTVLWGAPIAIIAATGTPSAVFVLLALVGLANTIVDVAGFTLLQRVVPDEVLARVFGVLESLFLGMAALGGIGASLLVDHAGIRTALVVSGLVPAAAVVFTWRLLARIDAVAVAPLTETELLRRVPFLALLPPPTLEQLASRLVRLELPAGSEIIREGDVGDRFYVLGRGRASVTSGGRHVADAEEGGYFGEIALLRDVPRTASVTADTDVEVYALERDDFLAAVTGHAASVDAAGEVVASRLERLVRPTLRSR